MQGVFEFSSSRLSANYLPSRSFSFDSVCRKRAGNRRGFPCVLRDVLGLELVVHQTASFSHPDIRFPPTIPEARCPKEAL